MIDQTVKELTQQMDKAIEVYTNDISKLRTGRANPVMVEKITVNYYGTDTPLNQMANITAPDAKTIVVQPWDQSALEAIEKAITQADLGVTPQNDGSMIRLPMPPMTEERRKEVAKQAGNIAEDARVSIRNIRRGGIDDLKKAQKDKEITEDDLKRGQDRIQELTDTFTKRIDEILETKTKDIMSV